MKTKISILLIALMAGLMTLTTESATAQTIRKGGSVYCRINNGTIYNGSGSKIGEADHVDAGLAAAIILFDVLK